MTPCRLCTSVWSLDQRCKLGAKAAKDQPRSKPESQPGDPTFLLKSRRKMNTLATPLTLPCGLIVKNRIAKAAMTESLADPRTNKPNKLHEKVYSRWSEGGLGMTITGNVIVDRAFREAAKNVCCESGDTAKDFQAYAKACSQNGCAGIVQLSHAGRQTAPSVNRNLLSSSDKRVVVPGMPSWLLGQPRAMTTQEIKDVVHRFAYAAKVMEEAGFQGVEIHAAHGYLISQFLSPLVNNRSDDYGGSAENRRRLLIEIIQAVREETSPKFCVGVKLNSADFQKDGFSNQDSIDVIVALGPLVDFVEISGGSYESAAMMNGTGVQKRESTKIREAFFLDFAKLVRQETNVPLMVTGGFRSQAAMIDAIESGACDMVGIARPLCLDTEFPNKLLMLASVKAETPPIEQPGSKSADAASFWYTVQIQTMAKGGEPDVNMSPLYGVLFTLRHFFLEPSIARPFCWIYNFIFPLSRL
jgi:2,4-dienoyl-CoA reductase-like NADH-dependent reductase (Old Yellow Enzyme family)